MDTRNNRTLATLLLCAAGLWGSTGTLAAQSRVWARGAFRLTAEARWDKKTLPPGEYEFKVENLPGTSEIRFLITLSQEGKSRGTFLAFFKEFVRGGQGLQPRLVLHTDAESGNEVAAMELPGPNYRLKFSCRHKKKKGVEPPAEDSVLFHKLD